MKVTEPMSRIGPPPPTPPNNNVVLPDPAPLQVAEFESDRNEVRSMLFDPLYAFAASWHYSRNLLFGVQKCPAPKSSSRYNCRFCSAPESSAVRSSEVWELYFGGVLNALCASPDLQRNTSLSGKSKNGLYAFWTTIGTLLDSWLPLRKEPNCVLFWSDTYPNLVAEMSRAQIARVAWLKRPNYFEVGDVKSPGLITWHRIRSQRTYSQAGKTAAYILWGEFLANGSSSIDFCEKCAHPFPFRSNGRFYPTSCGTNISSLKAHRLKTRTENWKRLQEEATTLHSAITSGKPVNLPKGMKNGRWFTRFVRAASLSPGSSEFQVQRDLLLDLCSEEGSKEAPREEVEKTLDQFLKNIAKSRPYIQTD